MNAQSDDEPPQSTRDKIAARDKTAAGRASAGMKTPDGRVFRAETSGSPLAAAGAAASDILRAIGKLIATIWRLARALDSALWRGVKLIAGSFWRSAGAVFDMAAIAVSDFAAWIPTRAGRAYTAASGLFLAVVSLWMIDELRSGVRISGPGVTASRPPIDRQDPIVARMGGRYVHLSDIRAAAIAAGQLRENETLTVKTAFTRELVQSFVEQRLLSRAAVDEGLQRNPEAARRLSAARDRILAAIYMDERIEAVVTPEAVENLYASQADVTRLGDEVRARHILVATAAEAQEIRLQLAAGLDFGELARARSLDRATAPLGGEIGYFSKDMMTPTLAAAAFATGPGELAPTFQTEYGWHLLEVLDRRATSGVSLKSVEDRIERFLTLKTIEQTLEGLKTEEKVIYYPPDEQEPREVPTAPSSGGAPEQGSSQGPSAQGPGGLN